MPTLLDSVRSILTMLDPQTIWATAIYPLRKARAAARWDRDGKPRGRVRTWSAFARELTRPGPSRQHLRDWPETWQTMGAIEYIEPTDRGARLHGVNGAIDVCFLASDLVRVRHIRPGVATNPEPDSYAIERPISAWPIPAFVCIQEPEACLMRTQELVVGITLVEGRVFFATTQGELIRCGIDAGWNQSGALRHRVALASGERIFGLGERATEHDRRGGTHILWNMDPAGYRDGDDPINLNIPVSIHAVPTEAAGIQTALVFYDNATYAEFDLGDRTPKVAEHRFAAGELRYFVAVGPPPRLLERYTELTGRHPLQPLWMLGYQQSRWSYDNAARVRKLAGDFRDHNVPCDAIYLDIDYMDGFRCFTWNREAFPNPTELAEDLQRAGIRLISMIDPGIKRDPDFAVYREGVEQNRFCTTPDRQIFHAPVWPGDSAFPDFTSAEVRQWWGQLYRPLLEDGIAGFWNDMNEPAAFASTGDRTLPDTVVHAMEGRGGTHAEAHNIYGMQMVRATREGLAALQPDRRPVVITRAGWAGVQRYATSWTADNESTWEGLRLTIPLMIGLGLSGLGFSGPDVGGFAGAADGELFTRWIQMATFMPFFRAHTAKGTPDQEPWAYGEPYLSIIRRFIELRYELLPYLYTATWQMSSRGWPVVRPLSWADPTHAPLWDIDDAFLCGDKLLVAPVLAPDVTTRQVALPPGRWYEFWTNRAHQGNLPQDGADVTRIKQFASLEVMPLLVRGGTVLTMSEAGLNVTERKDKFLRLNLYPLGEPGDAVTELYEDAGAGMDYKEGANRVSRFLLHQEETVITVLWDRSGAYNPPYKHIALTICGLERVPQAIRADGNTYAVLQRDPVQHSVIVGVPIFDKLEIIL